MLFNHIRLGIRHFYRNRKYSFFNILSLSLGLTLSVYMLLIFFHGLTIDRYHKNKDALYLLTMDVLSDGEVMMTMFPPVPVYEALKTQFTQVADATRVYFDTKPSLILNEDVFHEGNLYRVDSSFFSMFHIPLVNGRIQSLYAKKEAVFITQRISQKHFGNIIPLGQTIRIGDKDYTVEGILEDPPSNSSFTFDYVAGTHADDVSSWENFGQHPIYFQARFDEDIGPIVTALQARVDEAFGAGNKKLRIIPFTKQNTAQNLAEYLTITNTRYSNILLIIGLLILITSILNYINLATAQATGRFKEVALRKINGALPFQLMWKYLVESGILTFISLLLSAVALYLVIPFFNSLSGYNVHFQVFTLYEIGVCTLFIFLLVSIASGIYPALVLSGMRPQQVFKSNAPRQGIGSIIRRGLVIFQFSLTTILIIGTLALDGQLEFLLSKDLGYQHEGILTINATGNSWKPTGINLNYAGFKDEVAKLSMVKGVTIAGLPGADGNAEIAYLKNGEKLSSAAFFIQTDEDFTSVLNINLLEGSNLNAANPSKCLINAKAAQLFFNGDPIGKPLNTYEVAGIIEDFHYMNLYASIEPLVIHLVTPGKRFGKIQVRVSGSPEYAIEQIRTVWRKYSPDLPFEYSFLDDKLRTTYQQESRAAETFSIFSFISILISCLGLIGLVSYTLRNSAKAISIRKVVGASVNDILLHLLRKFVSPIILSVVIAIPIAYYFLSGYLTSYVYRIELSFGYFLAGGLLTIVMVAVITCMQGLSVAHDKPTKFLQHE